MYIGNLAILYSSTHKVNSLTGALYFSIFKNNILSNYFYFIQMTADGDCRSVTEEASHGAFLQPIPNFV